MDSFEGIVIAVSHDRYFLDRTINRIFAFEENGLIRQYEGGYTDYSIKKPQENITKANENTEKKDTYKKTHEKKLKFTFKEQKEFETIESDIEALENKISEIEKEMAENSTDFVKLDNLSREKEQTEELLSEKMERWEYLEELNAKIEEQNAHS